MRLIFTQACDCKAVVHHVSTPTASGVLRMSVGIRTRPDPFFSRPNDKEKKEVWQRETTCYTVSVNYHIANCKHCMVGVLETLKYQLLPASHISYL